MGIPLGGIGAGSFMINQSGTFGPWFFGGSQNPSWETRALPQAAFHVREQIGNRPATVRTLATDGAHPVDYKGDPLSTRDWEDPLPAWNTLAAGDADYAALYPFGWMTYKPFKTNVSMRFYSPIVAGDERRSSLPVAYFDVRISNDTRETAKVSTMFTMPNVAAHEGRQPVTVRNGLSSQYRGDKSKGIQAVTLSSDSPANTADAYKSEWTIAAVVDKGQSFTYTTSWNAAGDGADVYAPFSATGSLGNNALDSSSSAGAIAVSATLKPGETATIPFALSWDFPQVGYADNNTVWMRRYTDFYGARTTAKNDYIPGSYPFHQSYAIAKDALVDRSRNLRDVLNWWAPIVKSRSCPDWLKEATLNQLANVTFHTALWEGGLVRNTRPGTSGSDRIGTAIPGTHNYLGLDANSGGLSTLGQGAEIGIYSYSVYSDLFPTIERDRMRGKAEAILAGTSHGDPWDFSMTEGEGDNPFISWRPGTDSGPGLSWFLDRPSINVFRMYDYAQRHNDKEFLKFVYPAMKKTFAYLQKTIPADYALPEVPSANHPSPGLLSPQAMANAYNGIPSNRFDAYVSGLYILATEAMIAAGERMHEDRAAIDDLRADLAAAKRDFEKLFWVEQGGYYRYTLPETASGNQDAMIATFLAQYLAERAELPDVVNLGHYARHLKTVQRFTSGLTDEKGRPVGANLLGSAAGSSGGVWPQANYAFAANLVSAGQRTGDRQLMQQGLRVAQGVAVQLWDVPGHGYEFNTPISYEARGTGNYLYPGWEGNLAAWQLLDVLNRGR
ncbi:GH116 family glycosyl-hydrolase [Dactylosporangium sp. CA-233914]|uniref:GH116 family glycosyl-hydrolase n=1 Tax=Dactylosporangium sp. CA-233914 TaxID=3239934 RepID=UPI003D903C53